MGADTRSDEQYERGVAVQGARFAAALCAGDAGDPDEYRGWRGQLQMAVDLSSQDAELLTLADDVYAQLGRGVPAIALERFALRWMQRAVGRYSTGFLLGVLGHLVGRDGFGGLPR